MPAHAKPPKSSELKNEVTLRFAAAASVYRPVQAELALELGIDARQLNGYYRGKNYPDEKTIVDFCNLSGCTADWIYLGRPHGLPEEMKKLVPAKLMDLKAERKAKLATKKQKEAATAELIP